jgi:hypothetical protein
MMRSLPQFLIAVCLCLSANAGRSQATGRDAAQRPKPRFKVMHMKNGAAMIPAIRRQASTGATIPLWNFSLVSPFDNKTYTGQMVGRSPFYHGYRAISIPTYLIPVEFKFSDGTDLDPTTVDSCSGTSSTTVSLVQQSPIFQPTDWIMNGVDVGTTQYIDGFQRANFWRDVSVAGDRYHNTLALKTLPRITFNVSAANGGSNNLICNEGQIDINWWDNLVQGTILPSLVSQGVAPNTFPLFLFDSVELCDTFIAGNCGILGYHNAFTPNNVFQAYGIADFDNSGTYGGDISVLSHEVGEWMDDPTTVNPTPAWGNIGQVSGCQNNLEVGDPLTGTYFPPVTSGSYTYDPQELVFFSWFYRQSPSIGSGGAYSNNGTFTVDPPSCP